MRDRGWKAGGIKDRKKGKLQLKLDRKSVV